jgi:hypothetical protein
LHFENGVSDAISHETIAAKSMSALHLITIDFGHCCSADVPAGTHNPSERPDGGGLASAKKPGAMITVTLVRMKNDYALMSGQPLGRYALPDDPRDPCAGFR